MVLNYLLQAITSNSKLTYCWQINQGICIWLQYLSGVAAGSTEVWNRFVNWVVVVAEDENVQVLINYFHLVERVSATTLLWPRLDLLSEMAEDLNLGQDQCHQKSCFAFTLLKSIQNYKSLQNQSILVILSKHYLFDFVGLAAT